MSEDQIQMGCDYCQTSHCISTDATKELSALKSKCEELEDEHKALKNQFLLYTNEWAKQVESLGSKCEKMEEALRFARRHIIADYADCCDETIRKIDEALDSLRVK